MALGNPRKTRYDPPIGSATLDNGERIRCTPDHEFMLRDGSFARADQLAADASLKPRETNRYNHKVVSVEPIREREDVYCLTVPEYGNFALSAGVFVHNCGMAAVRTSLKASDLPDNLHGLRSALERTIPVGFHEH